MLSTQISSVKQCTYHGIRKGVNQCRFDILFDGKKISSFNFPCFPLDDLEDLISGKDCELTNNGEFSLLQKKKGKSSQVVITIAPNIDGESDEKDYVVFNLSHSVCLPTFREMKKKNIYWKDGDFSDGQNLPVVDGSSDSGESYEASDSDEEQVEPSKRPENPPKRPVSAYLFFASIRRPELKQSRPSLAFGELTLAIAAEWKTMGLTEKRQYEDMAKEDKKRYEKEKREYDSFLE